MKSVKRWPVAASIAAVAAVLVPLYAAPRLTRVTHPEWAHALMRALDLDAILTTGSTASLAFDALSWRTTFRPGPDRAFRHTGIEFLPGPPKAAQATSPGAELAYRIAVARSGDYRVRLGLRAFPEAPPVVELELTLDGQTKPTKTLSLTAAASVESEGIYLSSGIYTLSIALPQGPVLEFVEVVPPCLNSIEPQGGWQPTAVAQTGDIAVTVLKALDLETELPPAATPVELPSVAFQPMTGQVLRTSLKGDVEGFWLKADAAGLQAVAHVNLPEPGLYTVYGYGLAGTGSSWVVDACLKSVLCPGNERPELPAWRPLLSAEFSSGRHSLALTLANEAALQRIKLERKKDGVLDYLATLARLGLDLGSQRPVTRSQVADAVRFIEERRRLLVLSKCDDVFLPPGTLVAGLAIPGGATVGTGAAPPPGGPGTPPFVPLPGPTPFPSAPATASPGGSPSPSPSPGVSPSPSPSPVPSPTPSPSLGPPPTTVAQPPASPVKD